MKQLGPDSFEITNKKTGETKVVTGNELPQYGLKKPFNAANIAPAAGGIIGGLAGSIGGPVGAGLGAAAGTAAGGMIKSLVTPKKSTEFADPTKTGFGAKLSQEGKTTAGKDIANISKDAAIAGVSTYATGKAFEVGGKVISKVFNKQNIIDNIVKVSQKGTKTADKISLTKKIATDIDTAAKGSKAQVDYGKVLTRIVERANKELSGNVREAVIKNAAKETPKNLDLLSAITKKRGAGFLPNAKAATAKFNELLRQELKNEIHTVAPEIASLDEAYSIIVNSGKSAGKFLRRLGIPAAGVWAGTKIFGQK